MTHLIPSLFQQKGGCRCRMKRCAGVHVGPPFPQISSRMRCSKSTQGWCTSAEYSSSSSLMMMLVVIVVEPVVQVDDTNNSTYHQRDTPVLVRPLQRLARQMTLSKTYMSSSSPSIIRKLWMGHESMGPVKPSLSGNRRRHRSSGLRRMMAILSFVIVWSWERGVAVGSLERMRRKSRRHLEMYRSGSHCHGSG